MPANMISTTWAMATIGILADEEECSMVGCKRGVCVSWKARIGDGAVAMWMSFG